MSSCYNLKNNWMLNVCMTGFRIHRQYIPSKLIYTTIVVHYIFYDETYKLKVVIFCLFLFGVFRTVLEPLFSNGEYGKENFMYESYGRQSAMEWEIFFQDEFTFTFSYVQKAWSIVCSRSSISLLWKELLSKSICFNVKSEDGC